MARKTVTYLNELRRDVEQTLENIRETCQEIDESGHVMGKLGAHDLKIHPETVDQIFKYLKEEHRTLANLIKSFRKARVKYLEFF